jgi:hypothetical protein
LRDPTRDTPTIVQHVREGLQREFPTSDIPIVAGSAFWAKTAMSGSAASISHELSGQAKAYFASLAQQAGANHR